MAWAKGLVARVVGGCESFRSRLASGYLRCLDRLARRAEELEAEVLVLGAGAAGVGGDDELDRRRAGC
jgi:hypothetical protein